MAEMIIHLPVRTARGQNAREHWAVRARRVRSERNTTRMVVSAAIRGGLPLPAVVTLTRLSVGTLDDDNLSGACKGIRDGVADALGVDDADPRVTWRYDQKKVRRGEWGVLISIEPRP